jgi:hypothetical protein
MVCAHLYIDVQMSACRVQLAPKGVSGDHRLAIDDYDCFGAVRRSRQSPHRITPERSTKYGKTSLTFNSLLKNPFPLQL